MKERFFIASDEIAKQVDELRAKGTEALKAATSLAESLGGRGAVYSSGQIIGVIFDEHPGEGWRKKHEWVESKDRFYRPMLSTKKGKQIAAQLREIQVPTHRDFNSLVGLQDHSIIIDSPTGRGFGLRYAGHEMLADKLVFSVPDSDEKENWTEVDSRLSEISKADYLELQAKHERQKEAA